MNFNNIEEIKKYGFKGFESVKDLREDSSRIPKKKGVYLVLKPQDMDVDFLETGTGGHTKGNPNVSRDKLKAKRIKDMLVLYVGRTGRTLYKRINELLRFGQGENIGHRGGRYLWQINHSEELVICWKEMQDEDPEEIKNRLLLDFESKYSKLPFANRQRPSDK
ncbi:hypothetical protein CBG53_02115 [Porphyromonas gingivalis]|nr:hypothetical protein [Porphyromonas gingivalis]OWP34731.1 hypothetical protein CBG53_02115 [Porphyromonas gingivalis]PDP41373.1 hypothetical protein CLI84_05480 [Porphyromonas gingivalis]QUI90569.1 hypothetical protein KDH82_03105 [Porphyromonas gingivalis]QUI92097.1 hypothetical protein KC155_03095 [Porphyromonas gingivalis]